MIRPVFKNEIIGKNEGGFEPQYDIIGGDGEVLAQNAQLRLKNPIMTEGTPLNSVNLTNMFDFDNMESMRGHKKSVRVDDDGSIIEEISAIGLDIVNARRVTEFPNAETIKVTTTVYGDDGVDVLRQTIVNTILGDEVLETVV